MNTKLLDIVSLYLDQYAATHGLRRPLSAEQIKDAWVAFIDAMTTIEGASCHRR